jgi:hypothetical protein
MEANAYLGDPPHGKLPAMRCLVLAAVLLGCGDNIRPVAPDLLTMLRALPNVSDATEQTTASPSFRYIVVHFIQPVDHADPESATFLQEVSLLHKDIGSPLIVWTSGYDDYYRDQPVELTGLLDANQISIEHRYFGTSRPEPADWTKLTIDQMAADEHAIVNALRTIYAGAAISAGASKGGMTATYYRRYFPDDVDGTVPYVAPMSFGAPDPRYPAFVAALGPSACHQAVRDVAIELITNRRAAIEIRASAQAAANGYQYSRIQLGPAVESAIEGLEWSFWQYFGISNCPDVPAVTASDDRMFGFLDAISEIHSGDDDQVARFEPYFYQSDWQLGYPDDGTDYLKPYYLYGPADYAGALPVGVPAPIYDGGAAMHDVDGFVEQSGARLLFVYGQWDPWTGGAYALGGASDSLELVQAEGTHYAHLTALAPSDTAAALAKLASWTGVTPTSSMRLQPGEPRPPRVPLGAIRALRTRRASP